MLPTVRFDPIVPIDGFRWVYINDEGVVEPREPPADWPAEDYESTADELDDDKQQPVSVLCHRFFLATNIFDILDAPKESLLLGHLIEPRDLYLRFASERPTPATIISLANQYGFLDFEGADHRLKLYQGSQDLASAFTARWEEVDYSVTGQGMTKLMMAEPAKDWLKVCSFLNSDIKKWEDMCNTGDNIDKTDFLRSLSATTKHMLSVRLINNEITGAAEAEIVASSLGSLLYIQFVASIAGSVTHRSCRGCTKWMPIHPGAGRPEKWYCSDACRMRAYRKRKAASRSK